MCTDTVGLATSAFPDGTTGLSRNGDTVFRGLNLAGFAEYVVTAANGAVRIDPEVPLEVACVIGCAVQTGVGAVIGSMPSRLRMRIAADKASTRVRTW